MFFDKNRNKLEINNNKILSKTPNMLNLRNTLLNN